MDGFLNRPTCNGRGGLGGSHGGLLRFCCFLDHRRIQALSRICVYAVPQWVHWVQAICDTIGRERGSSVRGRSGALGCRRDGGRVKAWGGWLSVLVQGLRAHGRLHVLGWVR